MREETFLSPTCSLIKACASSVVVILYISTRRLISVAFINNFPLFLPSLYNDNFLYTDNKKYNMRKVTYEDIFFISIQQDKSLLFTDDIKNYIFLRLKYIFDNLCM